MHLKPKTQASYKSLLQTCVLPRWGQVQLGRITFGAVAEWVNDMQRDGRSASRVRRAYHLLTRMLHAAVKDGRLPRNPAIGVDLPRLTSKKRRYLRHDQLHTSATATGRYRVLVLTSGYCGLRWREASALPGAQCRPGSWSPQHHRRGGRGQRARRVRDAEVAPGAMAPGAGVPATLTLDRYGHLFPDELDAVAARLDEAARQAGVYRMCTEADPVLFGEEVPDREKAV